MPIHLQIYNVDWVHFESKCIIEKLNRHLQPIRLQFQYIQKYENVKSHLKSSYISLNSNCSFDRILARNDVVYGWIYVCELTTVDATMVRCKRSLFVFFSWNSVFILRTTHFGFNLHNLQNSWRYFTCSVFQCSIIAFSNTYHTLYVYTGKPVSKFGNTLNAHPNIMNQPHYIEDQVYLYARLSVWMFVSCNVFELFR